MLEQYSEHLWVSTNSGLPSAVWEQGIRQISFHTNSFYMETVMDAKALLNVAHRIQSVCAATLRAREQALEVLITQMCPELSCEHSNGAGGETVKEQGSARSSLSSCSLLPLHRVCSVLQANGPCYLYTNAQTLETRNFKIKQQKQSRTDQSYID